MKKGSKNVITFFYRVFEHEMRITFGDSTNTSFSDASFIDNVYIHPDFSFSDLENDIALIKLAKAAERTIRILKIPQYEFDLVASSAAVLGYSQKTSGVRKNH